MTIANATMDNAIEKRKSVVVSNISVNITADYLANYVATELNAEKAIIRATPLNSKGRNFNSLQNRILMPEKYYDALMTPNTWPKNVKVREYVYKRRTEGASIENFLEKTTRTNVIPPPLQTAMEINATNPEKAD